MPMPDRNTRGRAKESRVNSITASASTTARSTNTGSSLSIMAQVSRTTTEKPARKHFSLHRARTWSMASMVSSEAPG